MAAQNFGPGWSQVLAGSIDLSTATLKLMLVDETYTANPDQEFIDDGTADDAASHEITATNYVPGFAGGGRKTVVPTSQYSTVNNRTEFAIPDQTWSSLGGEVNDTIGGLLLYVHQTNDGASVPLTFFEIADLTTNGSDVTFDFLALGGGGNIRATY